MGHVTLADGASQTGVTVVRTHAGDPFLDKTPAAATVLNGFGKSTGLVQVQELGVLETPIALTNTFGVGTVANAQIRAAVAANPAIGRELSTVNPLVFECNDGYLNDIQAMAVQEAHYAQALAAAGKRMAQGAVGAGRGMSCFSFKGGIGSASRLAEVQPGQRYTVGALVLANFGRLPNLTVAGRPFGRRLSQQLDASLAQAGENAVITPEKGSIILLLATDAPLDARQLRRLSLRAGASHNPHRLGVRPWQRRHRAGLFHRLHRAAAGRPADAGDRHAARNPHRPAVRGGGAGLRAGHHCRALARRQRDRPRWPSPRQHPRSRAAMATMAR